MGTEADLKVHTILNEGNLNDSMGSITDPSKKLNPIYVTIYIFRTLLGNPERKATWPEVVLY